MRVSTRGGGSDGYLTLRGRYVLSGFIADFIRSDFDRRMKIAEAIESPVL
jgi:hypothetical protein